MLNTLLPQDAHQALLIGRLWVPDFGAVVCAVTPDDVFDLADGHVLQTKSDTPARLMPEQLGRIDWNNDLSKLVLDLNEAIGNLPDANSRAKMIRRLRRTLEDAS